MTYCVAIKVDNGLVFAADTRTSAGVDDVRSYSKLHCFDIPGERVFVILSAGNLATTQAVLNHVWRDWHNPPATVSLKSVWHMFDAAEYIGQLSVKAQHEYSHSHHVDFRTTLILGGQILGEDPALYLIYPEGNCITASAETPYLQIGESKYGKPILDRALKHTTPLQQALRCALISFDSTIRSNLSVGMPLDLLVYHRNSLEVPVGYRVCEGDAYFEGICGHWGAGLRQLLGELPAPPEAYWG